MPLGRESDLVVVDRNGIHDIRVYDVHCLVGARGCYRHRSIARHTYRLFGLRLYKRDPAHVVQMPRPLGQSQKRLRMRCAR